jgi:hypothetical protein
MRSSPRRLLEDPGLSAIERAVLDSGRRSPIDYDVDVGLERFRTNLAALAAAGATTAVASAAKGATGALHQGALFGKLGSSCSWSLRCPPRESPRQFTTRSQARRRLPGSHGQCPKQKSRSARGRKHPGQPGT